MIDPTRREPLETRDATQDRALAAAGRPDERDELAVVDGQVEGFERDHGRLARVHLAQSVEDDRCQRRVLLLDAGRGNRADEHSVDRPGTGGSPAAGSSAWRPSAAASRSGARPGRSTAQLHRHVLRALDGDERPQEVVPDARGTSGWPASRAAGPSTAAGSCGTRRAGSRRRCGRPPRGRAGARRRTAASGRHRTRSTRLGTISAPRWSISPNDLTISSVGISTTWNGTISVASSRMNASPEPRNRSRANA